MSDTLLRIDKVTIGASAHGQHVRDIVRDIDFAIPPGGVTALVGESGSGKTVVSRAVLGLLPPTLAVRSGDISLAGRSLLGLSPAALRAVRGNEVGMVFQEPMVSLNPSLTVGTQMGEALIRHRGMDAAGARALCIDMLRSVGIADPARNIDAYPAQFSGGMRQRIMLASVLATRPRLLIADEPTTALDAIMQRQVMDLMTRLTRETGTAILLVSHDLGLVSRYADEVVVMRRGEQIEQGQPSRILLDPQQDYTRGLVGALPTRGPRPARPEGPPLVEASDVSITYPAPRRLFGPRGAAKRAVDGVTFTLSRGETLAVVGESGSGKSTVGRALIRLQPVAAGRVRFAGEALDALSGGALASFRSRAQMVFQDPNSSLDPRMRLDALVAEPLRNRPDLSAAERLRVATEMLAEVGLGAEFARRFPHQLSGGQRQRVGIARAIVSRPDFVVADEAVSALDLTVQAQVLALLTDLQQRYGFAMLFISHDLGVVEQIADRVAVMYRGHLVEIGTRDDVFDRPQHPYTRRLLAATPRMVSRQEGGYALQEAVLPDRAERAWFDPDASPPHGRAMAQVHEAHFVGCAV